MGSARGCGGRAGMVGGGGRSECEEGGAREVVWEKGVGGEGIGQLSNCGVSARRHHLTNRILFEC